MIYNSVKVNQRGLLGWDLTPYLQCVFIYVHQFVMHEWFHQCNSIGSSSAAWTVAYAVALVKPLMHNKLVDFNEFEFSVNINVYALADWANKADKASQFRI